MFRRGQKKHIGTAEGDSILYALWGHRNADRQSKRFFNLLGTRLLGSRNVANVRRVAEYLAKRP
jgi:hypothetical protein